MLGFKHSLIRVWLCNAWLASEAIELKQEYIDEAIRNCEGIIAKKKAEEKVITLFDF